MGFSVLRCFEYVAECDMCGVMDIMHTGDSPTVDGQSIFVHDTQSAIKGFQFHRTKQGFICDDCYRQIQGGKRGIDMKIKTTVTEIECTANEIRQSNTVADGILNILRGCFNNLPSDCEEDEEEEETESEDK